MPGSPWPGPWPGDDENTHVRYSPLPHWPKVGSKPPIGDPQTQCNEPRGQKSNVLTYERLLLVQNFARKSDPDYKPCLPGRLVAAVPLAAKTPGATDTTRTSSAGFSTCFVTNTSPSSVATGTM